ncbi:hypothetical protein [uncultured Nostoc sp.]|uniref:hypothetical protein n=1 Tax=uncultured Nostoc sp. TaxID=340711 RepID=UPI0035CA8B1B
MPNAAETKWWQELQVRLPVGGLLVTDMGFYGFEWFDQWLLKPVDIDELVRAIAHLTGRSILLGELTSSY